MIPAQPATLSVDTFPTPTYLSGMDPFTRRSSALVILVVLVLPYARAPLCQAGSHEHADHDAPAGVHALVDQPGHGSEAAMDCHRLMGCAIVLQASLPVVATGFRAITHSAGDALAITAAPIRSRASPDTPPPKNV